MRPPLHHINEIIITEYHHYPRQSLSPLQKEAEIAIFHRSVNLQHQCSGGGSVLTVVGGGDGIGATVMVMVMVQATVVLR